MTAHPPAKHRRERDVSAEAADTMTPQAVAEYAVWYARKVKGPAATVAAALLEEFPWLREPLEAAAARGGPPEPGPTIDRDAEVIEWLREALGMDESWAEIARGIVILKRRLAP